MPKVRIVADYCSRGYRILEGGARTLGALPVSAALLARIQVWNDDFETNCHPAAYEDISGIRFDFVAFAREGLEIARAVKRELPGWTVTYWDESLDWYLAREPRTYRPAQAEYEITRADAFGREPRGSAGVSRPARARGCG